MCIPLPILLLSVIGGGLGFVGIRYAISHSEREWSLRGIGPLMAGTAVVLVLASVSLSSLDGVLSRTHVPGIADKGLTSTTGLRGVFRSNDEYLEIPQRWRAWQDSAGALKSRPAHVLECYLDIDSLIFIPAYALLLAAAFARLLLRSKWRAAGDRTTFFERSVFRLLFVSVVADQLENVYLDWAVRGPLELAKGNHLEPLVLRLLVIGKWGGILFVLIFGIAAPALIVLNESRKEGRLGGAVLWRLRPLLLTVGLFGGIVTLRQLQTPDAIRRWSVQQGIVTVVLVAAFGAVLGTLARRLLEAERIRTHTEPNNRSVMAIGAVLGVVGGFGYRTSWLPRGLLVPAGVLLTLGVIGWLVEATNQHVKAQKDVARSESADLSSHSSAHEGEWPRPLVGAPGWRALPGVLAVAPLILLAIGAAAATMPQTVYANPDDAFLQLRVLMLVVLAPAVGAVYLYWIVLRSLGEKGILTSVSHSRYRFLLALAAAYVWWRVIAAPWSFPQAVGALGITLLFLTFLAIALSAATRFSVSRPPPQALSVIGLRQSPLLAFFLAWILLAGLVDHEDYHDVRLTSAAATADISPTQAVRAWFDGSSARTDGLVHPMLFVAANGGGIKAAIWTAMVLDCVLGTASGIKDPAIRGFCRKKNPAGTDRWSSSLFVASGVSGGSVGLASYATSVQEHAGDWLWDSLGDDFVSPSLSWQMFVEVPRSILEFGDSHDMDRAEVLERGWERATRQLPQDDAALAALLIGDDGYAGNLSKPFFSASGAAPKPPYLMFNGTSVEDGCRLVVSSIRMTNDANSLNCTTILHVDDRADPSEVSTATRDAFPFMCAPSSTQSADIAFSTAALLSARFPFVSPSGRLGACRENAEDSSDTYIHVVDGGYGDNSGGASVAALWDGIEPTVLKNVASQDPCAVPVLLQIDSGYGPTPESRAGDINELRVPPTTWSTAREVRTIEGRDAAALRFRAPFPGDHGIVDRDAIVYLRTDPEGEAGLGWTMDDSTFTLLERQLRSNRKELNTVASWFDKPC